MTREAEMAELADALGSGPSFSNLKWRFESSFRQFRSLLAPFFLSAPICTDLQTLENQVSAVFACRFSPMPCKAFARHLQYNFPSKHGFAGENDRLAQSINVNHLFNSFGTKLTDGYPFCVQTDLRQINT